MKRFVSSEKKMVSLREFEKLERERELHARPCMKSHEVYVRLSLWRRETRLKVELP